MSEFIAEAQVLIRPNTAVFRADLEKQLLAATKGIVVPVMIAPVGAGNLAALSAAQQEAATSIGGLASAQEAQNTALREGAVLLSAEALAAQEDAAAQQVAGAATTKNTTALKARDAALKSGAAASAAFALAQEEVVGAASAASAATIRHTRSVAAVEVAEKAQADALRAGNIALIDAASNHLRLAEAEHTDALAALENARAQSKQAATSSQVQRAFLAQAAGAAGLRGAVLSSTTAFIAATVAAVALGKSIKGASDLNEEINKTQEVFGASADAILEWSKTTAGGIGIARVEALSAIGTFGELFRTLGVGTPKAAALSKQLVTLSADLASFFNKSPEQALQAIQSGLVGQARPLRQFGVFLTEARVKAEALIETGKKNVDSLSQQDRILARYNLILRDAAIASGDFARTQQRLANQSRTLTANLSDLGDEIGSVFLPNIEIAIQDVNKLFKGLEKIKDFKAHITLEIASHLHGGENGIEAKILGFAAGTLGPGGFLKLNLLGLKAVGKGLDLIGLGADHAGRKIRDLGGGFGEMDRDAAGSTVLLDSLAAALQRSADAADHLNSRLNIQALTLEAAQAPLSVRIAKQKQIIENDKVLVQQARKTGKSKTIQDALNQQISDENELESLQNEVLSNQKEAATKAKDAATKAQKARDEQFQALADLFGARQQKISDALSRAGISGNLNAEIRLNKALIAALQKELKVLRERLKTLKVSAADRKAILGAINTAIESARQEQLRLNLERTKNQQDQQKQRDDDRQNHLEAVLAIAETTTGKKDDARALRAIISFDEQRIKSLKKKRKLTRDEKIELDGLRVDLAQRRKALQDLAGESKKTSGAFFEFLQTQQGFAANLLGNLIPGFATGGLVGNSSAAAAGTEGLRQVAGGFEQPRGSVQSQAAVASSRERGVRPVQVDRTNQILMQILAALTGKHVPPEIVHNKQRANAAYDTLGAMGD